MHSENISIINRILFSRDAFLSMIFPALLYGLTYKFYGLTEAVFVSGVYALLASFILNSNKQIVFVFALFGLLEICIVSFIPNEWLLETIFIKSVIGSVQTALVFLLFSAIKKPIPQLFAEAASPELKSWEFSHTKSYVRVWQTVSFVWIVVYLAKVLVLLSLYPVDENAMVTINLVLGWPLYICLIVFSVPYVRSQFSRYSK